MACPAAGTLTVGPSADCPSIQAAVNCAAPGSPGTGHALGAVLSKKEIIAGQNDEMKLMNE